MAARILRISITNVYGGGDYTAQLGLGSQGAPVNVILDTGSSTIAVPTTHYDPTQDADLRPTSYAQEVFYGTGGWAGPLVTTNITIGAAGPDLTLQNAYLALADDQLPNNFGNADGILGLAYRGLNQAYNLAAYLQEQGVNPPVTYPWPFPVSSSTAALQQLHSILQNVRYDDIPPYFDQLESQGVTANKFAFHTLRSFPSLAKADPLTDPLNQGVFILGGGEEQNDLYTGSFVNVDVLDDLYYNVNLKAVQVGNGTPAAVAPLPSRFRQTMITNAIVDSGTNTLFLAPDVAAAVLSGLGAADSSFPAIIQQAVSSPDGLDASQLNLASWPDIRFTLTGETGNDVVLSVSPRTYWQVDVPSAGRAILAIANGNLPQSILGLPLMNNYYTVFDRSQDAYGVIRFAPIRPPS
ncbi:MAG: pepsin-like aspartic protease [Isosphaeraceae bacterium]